MKDMFDLPLRVYSVLESLHSHRYDGVLRLVGEKILIQETDRTVVALADTAGIRRDIAVDELQQGGLASAIQADKTDLVLGFDEHTGIFIERASADIVRKI